MRYRVVLKRSDEGIAVSVPGLPGCHSRGRTEEEALENIADAIRGYLSVIEEQSRQAETRFVEVNLDDQPSGPPGRKLSISELRRLPRHEQDARLMAQAAEAEHLYRTDPELTAFEAFGEDDGPYDEYPPTESR